MTVEMSMTTDREEIRNSADDDVPSDGRSIVADIEAEMALGRIRALATEWERKAPMCKCDSCRRDRSHAAAIRRALVRP